MKKIILTLLFIFIIRLPLAFGGWATLGSHFNGSDGQTSYTAETGQTFTFTGSAQLDTAQYKWTSSLLLDGTTDYVSVADSDDWYFGAGDATIDFWMRVADKGQDLGFLGQHQNNENFLRFFWSNVAEVTKFNYRYGNVDIIDFNSGTVTYTENTWIHVAVIKGWGGNSDMWAICYNGNMNVTSEDSSDAPNIAAPFDVGGDLVDGRYFNGWIDEFRILKGTAAWTANFTPPTSEYDWSMATPTRDVIFLN